jgi:hypothetical protein
MVFFASEARQADRFLDDQLDLTGDDLRLVGLVEGEAQGGEEVVLRAHVHVDEHADLDRGEGVTVRRFVPAHLGPSISSRRHTGDVIRRGDRRTRRAETARAAPRDRRP